MYANLHIRNLRGIQDLVLDDLRRINLLVGPNSIGKTTILEALWLLSTPGNPNFVRSLATFRGIRTSASLSPELDWEPLFHNLHPQEPVEIDAARRNDVHESLKITMSLATLLGDESRTTDNQLEIMFGYTGDTSSSLQPTVLTLEFKRDDQPPIRTSAASSASGDYARLELSPATIRPAIFLSVRTGTTPDELASRFTEAIDANEIRKTVEALSILQHGLQDLSLGFTLPDRALLIRAHLEGIPKPIPIGFLGDGIGRLLEILLAVNGAPGGIVLVDEIERGIYYKNLPAAWSAIATAARQSHSQVFATTHSAECVQAAIEAFGEFSEEDFRLFRIERMSGKVRAVDYDFETAEAAIELGLEFR